MSDRDANRRRDASSFSPGSFGWRLVLFAVLWFVLTGGRIFESWYIGVPTVITAAWVGQRLSRTRRQRLRVTGLIRFIPYFLHRSLVGGIDVAVRALRPSRPISPDIVDYEVSLSEDGAAIVFFAAVISLLPGTLCAELGASSVQVHVVDRDWPIEQQLAELEARVARIFGETIQRDKDPNAPMSDP